MHRAVTTMRAERPIAAGQLVTLADVAPWRPTLHEYLARRELALDLRAWWAERGYPMEHVADCPHRCRCPRAALHYAGHPQYLTIPSRDRAPVALP